MNRRHLLQRGGASILLIGAAACSGQAPASGPWIVDTATHEDIRLRYLSHAILAPSPHNRQPWLVELDTDDPDRLTIWPDLTRLLPETDPYHRQITIGLGAFLEALSMAASQDGRSAGLTLFPDGSDAVTLDARPVATVTFGNEGSSSPDPLFAYLTERRTNRTRFDDQAVPKDELLGLATALQQAETNWSASSDTVLCGELREICKQGWGIESATPRTHLESVALTRIGRREIEANPDGISLSGPMMQAYSALGVLTREKMKDPESRASAESLKFYNGLIDSARSFAWLMTDDNRRESQLAAGRDWLRVHLAATRAGLAFQPLSQVLQEFPEMRTLYDDVHDRLSVRTPARIQGLFRIGYAKSPDPSPRWPMDTRLIDMPPR